MHRVVGIIAEGNTAEEVRDEAEKFLNDSMDGHIQHQFLDWYQGVKESGRWDLEENPDEPIFLSSPEAVKICSRLLRQARDDFDYWYKKGQEALNGEEDDDDFGSMYVYFSLAGGSHTCWLFDYSSYSRGADIRDQRMLDKVIKNADSTTPPLYLCLFDTHN